VDLVAGRGQQGKEKEAKRLLRDSVTGEKMTNNTPLRDTNRISFVSLIFIGMTIFYRLCHLN